MKKACTIPLLSYSWVLTGAASGIFAEMCGWLSAMSVKWPLRVKVDCSCPHTVRKKDLRVSRTSMVPVVQRIWYDLTCKTTFSYTRTHSSNLTESNWNTETVIKRPNNCSKGVKIKEKHFSQLSMSAGPTEIPQRLLGACNGQVFRVWKSQGKVPLWTSTVTPKQGPAGN